MNLINYKQSKIWKRTLEPHDSNFGGSVKSSHGTRVVLSTIFERLRANIDKIAEEIEVHLPHFTDHSIRHIDSLWGIADEIVGDDYELTTIEGFVLGCAFCIHDIGMSLSAYPTGLETIREDPSWKIAYSDAYYRKYGTFPEPISLMSFERDLMNEATGEFMRRNHAEYAERILFQEFTKDDSKVKLINENQEFNNIAHFINEHYADDIGRIAASHHWSLDKIRSEFSSPRNAPDRLEDAGECNLMKVACILRCADAAHVTGGRALDEVYQTRLQSEELSDDSKLHWIAQRKIDKLKRDGDRLLYTSSRFTSDESEAWWVAHELLLQCHNELQLTDIFLNDAGIERFRAKSVAYIYLPEMMSKKCIRTDDSWIPVNAKVAVTDVEQLAQNLGGEQLYGNNILVPIRELIQNAADAVRARRIIDRQESFENMRVDWIENDQLSANNVSSSNQEDSIIMRESRLRDYIKNVLIKDNDAKYKITVRLQRKQQIQHKSSKEIADNNGEYWELEIEDTGIGMTKDVIIGSLLDFGSSYWGSELQRTEYLELSGGAFTPTGKFGIGFFSVFMLGDEVTIVSKSRKTASTAYRLKFSYGLKNRPVLSIPNDHESRVDCGTKIKIRLNDNPYSAKGILFRKGVSMFESENNAKVTLQNIIQWLCPSLDVNVSSQYCNEEMQCAIIAGDWLTIEPTELMQRTLWPGESIDAADLAFTCYGRILSEDNSDSNQVTMRAALRTIDSEKWQHFRKGLSGVLTIGGFRANTYNFCTGIICGDPRSIVRDKAVPIITHDSLEFWINNQIDGYLELSRNDKLFSGQVPSLAYLASIVRGLGFDTKELPIAMVKDLWVSIDELNHFAKDKDFLLMNEWAKNLPHEHDMKRTNNYIDIFSPGLMLPERSDAGFVKDDFNFTSELRSRSNADVWGLYYDSLRGAAMESMAIAWNCSLDNLLDAACFHDDIANRNFAAIGVSPAGEKVIEKVSVFRNPNVYDKDKNRYDKADDVLQTILREGKLAQERLDEETNNHRE